ncbi:SCO2400 family protein, partial [Streptomyces olivaceus]|uniref:SCO2400 family protein n=1 Tax=Streptomyces olivaceus TaxID=47716 RepID=UPI0040578962
MDYCSSCRRHLNGALVCPGCGAYAPDIDPHVAGDDGDEGDAVPPAPVSVPVPALAVAPVADIDVGDVPPARQQGRAARRRQLARWKKNKRRAVVASAVALVGGGLTLASMDRHSDDRAQAATASDNRDPSVGAVPQGQRPPATTAPAVPERTHRSSSPAPGPSQPQAGPTADGAAPQQPVASRHRSAATAPAEDDG